MAETRRTKEYENTDELALDIMMEIIYPTGRVTKDEVYRLLKRKYTEAEKQALIARMTKIANGYFQTRSLTPLQFEAAKKEWIDNNQ